MKNIERDLKNKQNYGKINFENLKPNLKRNRIITFRFGTTVSGLKICIRTLYKPIKTM